MKRKKAKKIIRWIFPGVVILLLLLTFWYEIPVTEHMEIEAEEIDSEVRIALVTDLHSCYYGKNMNALVKRVDKENPDLVLMAGDIFDDDLKDTNARIFVEDMVKKYPCFYVTGNHEYWSERVDEIKEYLKSTGVSVLEGNYKTVEINGNSIDVCGVDDPTRLRRDAWRGQLESACVDDGNYKILLSHRPEEVIEYAKYDYDLIVAGHAHGGQWRIPFTKKGYFAPNQGMFATYVDGLYNLQNGSKMVVSRGLARESTPAPRFFNHPELIIITLK